MTTCRCFMCGRNDAGRRCTKSYLRVGIIRDEDGYSGLGTKKMQRRLRRKREARAWRQEISVQSQNNPL